jgi:hypothetical protein
LFLLLQVEVKRLVVFYSYTSLYVERKEEEVCVPNMVITELEV